MIDNTRRAGTATASAPAGIGNIGVGFDLLGHTITGPADRATVRRIDEPVVRITAITGDAAGFDRLPLEAGLNTAGRALIELRERHGLAHGFELALHKGIPLGSGLGGSAASCVAALVAANALLDAPITRDQLYPLALVGEAAASGSPAGDNVAPMLLGGVVLSTPVRVIALAAPRLYCAAVHPDYVLETRRAREALTAPYPLADFVRQSGHLALFLTGLARGDLELVAEGLRDVLVEPRRAPLIPGFAAVREAALAHGALGASISGAGPTVFGWFADRGHADTAARAMQEGFARSGLRSEAWVSPVAGPRAELVD
ncbi:serine kinase [Lysobacter arseniciresistens ZS79]|uniref:Homoserine kinase n=1 Tax=Lysobacter arseniciresistens ZS79 TaxID=913325 RepID=A0A0A0EWL8_9GAMM|nr:homoserine kinase [Lysobacter arseniciresistens]KGM54463.1 serine kinase [Lysobacter arseniciresistens ZS79]